MPQALEPRPQDQARWWTRRPPSGLAGAAFWLALWFGLLWLLRQVPGAGLPMLGWMQLLVGLALIALAVPLASRLVRRHLLWSLRNKLVFTYLLIGLAPAILFITLVALSAYIAAGQFSIHLADTRMRLELDEMGLENTARIGRLAHLVNERGEAALVEAPPDPPRPRLQRHASLFLNGAPVPAAPSAARSLEAATPPAATGQPPTPLGLPPWVAGLPNREFRGLVLDGQDLYLVAIDQRRVDGGDLLSVIASLPVDAALMDVVAHGLGRVRLAGLMTGSSRTSPASSTLTSAAGSATKNGGRAILGQDIQRTSVSGGVEPPRVNLFDLGVPFASTMDITDWDTGTRDSVPIEVHSRPSMLYRQLFGASLSGIVTSYIRIGLVILWIVFALIQLLALVMAMRLSRTITASVAELYDATQRVDRGDLVHRIAVPPNQHQPDQLDELSRSFNRMTRSLSRLIEEQKEKERLQSELSIAQEVQANLFPQHLRNLPTLQLHGVCRPARSVSGDYYDFLFFHHPDNPDRSPGPESGVAIVLGDISGKGISAALLMATLHSAVRAYRFAGEALVYSDTSVAGLTASREGLRGDGGKLFESPGRILSLLNRHLFRSTQPEKYATLFLAHYDAAIAQITYSNAGHLPPLVLSRDGKVRRLDCGGTVVGLMDGMRYEEGRFQMKSGDLLVAYSDGVTEPENDFGDFGESRLMEVVARYRDHPLDVISAQVMLALDAWIGAEEQPDDITLVLARQI